VEPQHVAAVFLLRGWRLAWQLVGWTAFAHPSALVLRRAGAGEPPPMVLACGWRLALGLMVMIWDLFWFTG